MQVGDFVERLSHKYRVLAVAGEMVALSYRTNHKNVREWSTFNNLKDRGYTIVQPETNPEVAEMTVAEISKALGKEVKVVE